MSEDSLASVLQHDAFFQRIIDMIPSDLYKTADIDEEEMNSRYFKHRQVPLAPHEKKVLSKKKRDEKYSTQEVHTNQYLQAPCQNFTIYVLIKQEDVVEDDPSLSGVNTSDGNVKEASHWLEDNSKEAIRLKLQVN